MDKESNRINIRLINEKGGTFTIEDIIKSFNSSKKLINIIKNNEIDKLNIVDKKIKSKIKEENKVYIENIKKGSFYYSLSVGQYLPKIFPNTNFNNLIIENIYGVFELYMSKNFKKLNSFFKNKKYLKQTNDIINNMRHKSSITTIFERKNKKYNMKTTPPKIIKEINNIVMNINEEIIDYDEIDISGNIKMIMKNKEILINGIEENKKYELNFKKHITYEKRTLYLNIPLKNILEYKNNLFVITNKDYDLIVGGNTINNVILNFEDVFFCIWDDIAKERDAKLYYDALKLKKKLLKNVSENKLV